MQVTRRPTSTTASTTCESGAALSILVVVASLSGNTRELGRQIAERCRAAGHSVHWQEADDLRQAPPLAADEADLVLLGCWTDNAGRTPSEMKAWVAGIAERGERPRQLAVFGTGETQWGQEYYCGAVHRLIATSAATIRRWKSNRCRMVNAMRGPSRPGPTRSWPTIGATPMQIIDATTPEQFRQLLAEHPRVLVDFHKDQCPGCRMLEMSLHRVANSAAGQGTTLLRVQLEVLGEAFFRELGLRQTPTLSLFRDGNERTRLAGFQSPQQIEAAIALHL